MSYHLTILRSTNGRQIPITLDEARDAALAEGRWEFTPSPPTFELKCNAGSCTLWYDSGELWAKTPEPWELEPMLSLARILNARVRGDEFETYESVEKTYFHSDDLSLRREAEARSKALVSKSTRNQKFIRNGIVGFFFALAVAGYWVGKWIERQ